MRTAEQIFNGYKRLIDSEVSTYWCTEKDFIEAVNEARIEAIKECAETVVTNYFDTTITADELTGSILNLIKQVK